MLTFDKFLKVKENTTWKEFAVKPLGLTIDFFSVDLAGYCTGWELATPTSSLTGSTIEELVSAFDDISRSLDFNQVVVVYVEKFKLAYGFLQHYAKERFSNYYFYIGRIQIRSIEPFIKDVDEIENVIHARYNSKAKLISEYMTNMYNSFCIPDNELYLTNSQIVRKHIKKSLKQYKNQVLEFPTMNNYWLMDLCKLGGICYNSFPHVTVDKDIIKADLNSAYIYNLLAKKHKKADAKWIKCDVNEWVDLINDDNYIFCGEFEISYICNNHLISFYSDTYGDKLTTGGNCVKMTLTNVDLKILKKLCSKINIVCTQLIKVEVDYLPKYFTDVIITEYTKKTIIDKDAEPVRYKCQKKSVNSIFGDCIRDLFTKDDYDAFLKHHYNLPEWGIWTAAYGRELLLEAALNIECWLYSDTDSIYCIDNEQNRNVLSDFNNNVYEHLNRVCKECGYNFSDLKELGSFDIETGITKFRANCQKQYGYIQNNKFHLVAAGLNQKRAIISSDDFFNGELEFPEIIRGVTTSEDSEVTINGKTYKSHGSYYEVKVSIEANMILSTLE